MMPGRVSGNVTCQNDWKPLAPRSRAASSRRLSSFSMDAYSGKTMNGRNVYRMPINTAKSPYMKDTGCSVIPSHTSSVLMSPLALRIRMSA